MMVEKDDLGLSLSLNFPAAGDRNRTCNSSLLQLNLMPAFISSSSSSPFNFLHKTLNWTDSLPSSPDRNKETRSFVNVNRTPPTTAEVEGETGVSSPYSTVSGISGKRSERDLVVEDHDAERASSRGISDEDDGENCRKKLRLSKEQSAVLEETFKEHSTLNPKQKLALAKKLGLRPRQVEVWFQNRRARTKLKQTEVDCEFLKRCCENLTEENRRLEKELQELRALKLSPHFYMAPPTTLTMCPSCEHVAGPPPSSTAAMPEKLSDHHHHHQMLPFNPWATTATPIGHRPLDLLRPQS